MFYVTLFTWEININWWLGLRDTAYSTGVFLGNIGIIGVCLSFVLLGNSIFNYGYFWSADLFHWLFSSVSFCLATMAMNMNLSFLIKNPKIAADVSGLYIFGIVCM